MSDAGLLLDLKMIERVTGASRATIYRAWSRIEADPGHRTALEHVPSPVPRSTRVAVEDWCRRTRRIADWSAVAVDLPPSVDQVGQDSEVANLRFRVASLTAELAQTRRELIESERAATRWHRNSATDRATLRETLDRLDTETRSSQIANRSIRRYIDDQAMDQADESDAIQSRLP